MRLYATPAPSGNAVKLLFGIADGQPQLLQVPDGETPNPSQHRDLLSEGQYYDAPNPRIAREVPALNYYQCIDLKPVSGSGYALFVDGLLSDTVGLESVPEPTISAFVTTPRDFIATRLEYHLDRFVNASRPRIRPQAGFVPVLEDESLARDDALPAVLLKETLIPMQDAIGSDAGESSDGAAALTSHRYRSRVDLLALSDNPAERTSLSNLLHEALLIDKPLLEDSGHHDVKITRRMTSGQSENLFFFGEEITVEAEVVIYARHEYKYEVKGLTTQFVATP